MITKGYKQKPDSKIAKQVVKGFKDNPFLKKKNDRKNASPLRHDKVPLQFNQVEDEEATK